MTLALWLITGVAFGVSLFFDRKKTLRALKMSVKRMWKIFPIFLLVMLIFSLSINLIPHEFVEKAIGRNSGIMGLLAGLGIGSIALMPGFIAFPLCAALQSQGVPYYILAGFSLALMNVGIMSFPLEKRYLGWKVAVVRNVAGLIVSIVIAVIVGLAFGEINL